jgi:tetratricopeptide (TPR) repeat protein
MITKPKKGMYEEAIKEIQIAKDLYGSWRPDCEALIGIAFVYLGKIDEAKQALDKLLEPSKRDYVSAVRISQLYFALKEDDQGFMWLEKAYEDRAPLMKQIGICPEFDRIRAETRFKAMLKKMNLE